MADGERPHAVTAAGVATAGGVLPAGWVVPALDPYNRTWFTSGTLAVQRCLDCGTLQHPPEEICHGCGSMELGTTALVGRGTVHSFTVVHYPASPALAEAVPYTVVLVSLDDAPRLRVVGNLLEGEARIGLSVVTVWEERTAEDGTTVLLPQWIPA
jgi:hypothetical protein